MQSRLQPTLLAVGIPGLTGDSTARAPRTAAALRVSDTLAIALLPDESVPGPPNSDFVAVDAASGLALLNVESGDAISSLTSWTPARPRDPRYLLATTTYATGVSFRPAFVSALEPVLRPAWPGQLWRAASGTDLEPGSFVFTTAGDFAGLVIDDAGGRAIVGADVLQLEIARLRERRSGAPGQLGVEVQPLSPTVAKVTGATGGIVVTWVDPDGAAADVLATGDVIEEANGERLTADSWRYAAPA